MFQFTSIKQGSSEIVKASRMHGNWFYMGLQDIKLRYRRSTLGPFWLTLSTAVTIAALSLLWSIVLSVELKTYLPYFAIGQIFWIWISTQILESSAGFSPFENSIKQIKLPFPIYILRMCLKNFIVLAHNFLVALFIIVIIYPSTLSPSILLFIPALIIIQLITFSACIILSVICTRYRDLTQIVNSLMQLAFFFTPILWTVDTLGNLKWIATYNPLFHFISIIRLPLLGQYPSSQNWIWAITSLFIITTFASYILGKFSNRVAYWL